MKPGVVSGDNGALVPVRPSQKNSSSSWWNPLSKILSLWNGFVDQPITYNEETLPQLTTRVNPSIRENALQILHFEKDDSPKEKDIEINYKALVTDLSEKKGGCEGPLAIYFQRMIDDAHTAFTTLTGKKPFLKESV